MRASSQRRLQQSSAGNLVSIVAIASGCAASGPTRSHPAAEAVGGSVGGAEWNIAGKLGTGGTMQGPHKIGDGTDDCIGGNGTALRILPEQAEVAAFRFFGTTECESLGTSVLLKNLNSTILSIYGLSVGPAGFSVGASLPVQLNPGATLAVSVKYTGADTTAEGTLTVATSDGCFHFAVRGLASDEGVMTYSDSAIDFGDVERGASSESRPVSILLQYAANSPGSKVQGFSVYPEEMFAIVSYPEITEPESCAPLQVAVRFNAPREPGEFTGTLGWSVVTELSGTTYEGTVSIPLYGTSR